MSGRRSTWRAATVARGSGVVWSLALILSAPAMAVEWSRVEIPIPGVIVDSEIGSGGRGVTMLIAVDDEAGPRRVLHLDAAGPPSLSYLGPALDGEPSALELVDLDRDGRPEVVVADTEQLTAVASLPVAEGGGPLGVLGPITEDELSQALVTEGAIVVPRPGGADRWTLGPNGLESDEPIALPVEARRRSWGLEVWSPPVRAAGGQLVAGPVGDGPRIGTRLLGAEPEIAWSQLPGTETIESARYDEVDGQLVLVVNSIAKKGVFAKLSVRIFHPKASITRAGDPPVFQADTGSNFWNGVDARFADLDRNGVTDLVLLYPEGMGGGNLQLDTYRGLGGGRFDTQYQRTKLDIDEAQRAYGDDVTGDGIPDLVTLSGSQLAIWKGLTGPAAWRVVGKESTWSLSVRVDPEMRQEIEVEVGEGDEAAVEDEVRRLRRRRMQVRDLDGDGVAEILIWGREANGFGHLTLVRPAAAGN